MRAIKYIVIHCTATAQTAKVESIQRYWRETMNWNAPGYHKIIRPDGSVVTLLPESNIANGVGGYNSHALHVSYIGGIDPNGKALDNRTTAQIISMVKIVAEWKCRYPAAQVLGHRDFPKVAKDCPSFDAIAWWNSLPH